MTPPPSRAPVLDTQTEPSTPCPKLPRKRKRISNSKPPVRKVIPFHRLKRRKSPTPTLDATILAAPKATLLVGAAPETPFQIHMPLLCAVSPFFACALQGPFKEASTKTVRLPAEDPKVVDAFVAWLYTGRLSGCCKPPPSDGPHRWIELARLWIFGDCVRARKLQDDAMGVLLFWMHHDGPADERPLLIDLTDKVQVDAIDEVYEHTVPESPLRKVIIDTFMWQKGDKVLPCNVWLPREFRYAVATLIRNKPDSEMVPRQFVNSVSGYFLGVGSEEAAEVLREHKRFWRKKEDELRIAVGELKLTE